MKDKVNLRETHSMEDFMECLTDSGNAYSIILAVCDTPGDRMPEQVLSALHRLGFRSLSKELWRMYVGVVKDGDTLIDCLSSKMEDPVYGKARLGNSVVEVESHAWRKYNKAVIKINGVECAVNKRGLNIAVYEDNENVLIDSVWYDSHEERSVFEHNVFVGRINEKISWLSKVKNYDVCVVGFWYGANYGSLLNGYATYRILEEKGKRVLMLNKPFSEYGDGELRPENHNRKFTTKYYPQDAISPLFTYEELPVLNKYCDCFCAGSDQIWNYDICFDEMMYLPFVNDDKQRISFVTSFGSRDDHVPGHAKERLKNCFRKYDAISVREEFDKEILFQKYGVESTVLIDPIFCLQKSDYEEIAKESKIKEDEAYIVAYILDPTDEKLEYLLNVGELLNEKIITVPDGYFGVMENSWADYPRRNEFPNLHKGASVSDFLKLYMKADFVVTDSFHGTAFSIMFQKRFVSICNHIRGKDRFYDLLGRFFLTDRLIEQGNLVWKDEFVKEIAYESIVRRIEEERKKTSEWLDKALVAGAEKNSENISEKEWPITKNLDISMCMGCGACASSCPKDAIKLVPDKFGYYRPMVSYSECVDCGYCTQVCPARAIPEKKNDIKPRCYEFMAADERTLMTSSSGGAFPVFAEEVFRCGGIVIGAAWRDQSSVEHILIESKEELPKLQKSKYLQSYMGTTLREVKKCLDNDKFVLFSGCPCQVAGLKKFLGKDYEKLLMVDILCSHAPSVHFFNKYLFQEYPAGVRTYNFRTKAYGQDCTGVEIIDDNGIPHLRHGAKEDNYQRAFHSHTMCAIHCENCKYQEVPRYGDITIGDFWGLERYDKIKNAYKGVSVVLANNAKGENFLHSLPRKSIGLLKEVPLDWLGGNGYAIQGSHNWINPHRDDFYDAIQKMPFREALNYALKPNHGHYLKQERNMALGFEARNTSFSFDPNIWEQQRIKGMYVLFVKQYIDRPGVYATISLDMPLKQGRRYILHARFKARTESKFLNFHVKDSGSREHQVIYRHRMEGHGDNWIELKQEFVADSDLYDEFFFGASQIRGEEAYLAIDYLHIIDQVNQPLLMNQAWERFYDSTVRDFPWKKFRDVLCNTDDIVAYLELLLIVSKKCTVILSVRDTPGNNLLKDILERIYALGFTNFSKELWRMYIGFIDAGQVLCNQAGEAPEKPVFFQCQTPGNTDEFKITSKAWRQGNLAEIIINGVDFSTNLRGINLVVYDREKHEVWDSVGFDGHDFGVGFVRREI